MTGSAMVTHRCLGARRPGHSHKLPARGGVTSNSNSVSWSSLRGRSQVRHLPPALRSEFGFKSSPRLSSQLGIAGVVIHVGLGTRKRPLLSGCQADEGTVDQLTTETQFQGLGLSLRTGGPGRGVLFCGETPHPRRGSSAVEHPPDRSNSTFRLKLNIASHGRIKRPSAFHQKVPSSILGGASESRSRFWLAPGEDEHSRFDAGCNADSNTRAGSYGPVAQTAERL